MLKLKHIFIPTALLCGSLMMSCSSAPTATAAPLLEQPEETPALEDTVTTEKTFTLEQILGGQVKRLAFPADAGLTVQILTSKSKAKPGWKYGRAKWVLAGAATTPVPLEQTLTLYTTTPRTDQTSSAAKFSLQPGKTTYRSGKAVDLKTVSYENLCAVVELAGITTAQPLEVCESSSAAATTPAAARVILEPLAALATVPSDSPWNGWNWQTPVTADTSSAQTFTLEAWPKLPNTPAWHNFAAELHRQFSSVKVYETSLSCAGCHTFDVVIVGTAAWGQAAFTASIHWDS